jgi:hypothetical protein
VTNRFGHCVRALDRMAWLGIVTKLGGKLDRRLAYTPTPYSTKKGGLEGGSIALLRPDGTKYEGSPFTGGGLPGPLGVVHRWQRLSASPTSPARWG